MTSVDTHVHVWDLSRFSYSWTKGVPALHQSFGMEQYREANRDTNISKVVLVEADVDEPYILDEARFLLSLAERDNLVGGVVTGCRPEKADFAKYLQQIAGHPQLKGVRRVLHSQPDDLGQSRVFIENVQRLQQYGLSYDICVLERQLPSVINLVKECPGVTFILDHCGGPQATSKVLDPWRARVREISQYPNVACKISGLVGYEGRDAWVLEDIRPCVEHVIHCFGWERVIFGSDWPVCTLSTNPKEWIESVSTLTRDHSEDNRLDLFSRNAEKFYRL